MLRIEMLPARQGDALWIEYGEPEHPHRILYDGGTRGCWEVLRERIGRLSPSDRRFELLIVSHIDLDHIGGVLPLLEDHALGAQFDDIWFNGFRHLPGALEPMGPIDGERLTKLLVDDGHNWNQAFHRHAVAVAEDGSLPERTLAGGLKLTIMSPRPSDLARLRPAWAEVVRQAGLDPATPAPEPAPLPPELEALGTLSVEQLAQQPFKSDTAEANGSSIAVLAEHDGKCALLCADAPPDAILQAVARLLGDAPEIERLRLDVFKLPHHGSRANLHMPLLHRIHCPTHLISTDGTQTRHPNPEAIARVIVTQDEPRLIFNYRTTFTEIWDPNAGSAPLSSNRWDARFPAAHEHGIVVHV